MPHAIEPLLEVVRLRYDAGVVHSAHQLEGGEWKTLYRLDMTHGSCVLSISHPSAEIEGVAWEHAFLRYLAPRLPQVPAPIAARDGNTHFTHKGRIASLWPFMPGQIVAAAQIRLPAAQLLAQYHRAAMAYPNHTPRRGIPALRQWRWDSNHAWRWPEVEALLNSTPETVSRFWRDGGMFTREIVVRRGQIAEERAACARWVAQLVQSGRRLAFAPIHDDYCERNLLRQGDKITALLDWDGCHPDWLMMDLSNAVWEFCQLEDEHMLDVAAASDFVQVYVDADGPVERAEFDLLVPFMRFRRILESLSGLQNVVNGEQWNEVFAEYALHTLLSLENLQHIKGFGQ